MSAQKRFVQSGSKILDRQYGEIHVFKNFASAQNHYKLLELESVVYAKTKKVKSDVDILKENLLVKLGLKKAA